MSTLSSPLSRAPHNPTRPAFPKGSFIQPLGPQFRNARIRAFLAKHAIIIGGASVLTAFIFVMAIRSCTSEPTFTLPTPTHNAYFYDVQDSALIELSDNLVPPFKRSGHEIVRAAVFACKSCDAADDRFIGYLSSFTPERQKAEEAVRQSLSPGEELPLSETSRLTKIGGVLIRHPIGTKFIPADDPEAQPILDEYLAKCPQTIIQCKPK